MVSVIFTKVIRFLAICGFQSVLIYPVCSIIALKYVFFLFSSDLNEKRNHIHVRDRKGKISNLCKFWLEPEMSLSYNKGFSNKELVEIELLIKKYERVIIKQVALFHSGKKVKSIIIK